MQNIIPSELRQLAEISDRPLYIVGGACRNFLAGLGGDTDWDICAPMRAEELVKLAERAGMRAVAVYAHTGTVRLACGQNRFEFASFRTDRYVRGTHSPAEVEFTDDIFADALRRDFRCNAVYYDISRGIFVDPLGGTGDIRDKILRTTAPSGKVFGEDGLRLMRLCRFAAELGFVPSADCLEGARENAALIADIAPERIYSELTAILSADVRYGINGGQYAGLKLLADTGVLAVIIPELAMGEGMAQRADFHNYDVLEHSFRAVLYSPPRIRLAALLHDSGKPACMAESGSYARHEEAGERIAEDILRRLRAPSAVISRVCALVRWHMYDFDCRARESKVRRFMAEHSDILDDLLALKQADYSACKDDLGEAPGVRKWRDIYDRMRKEGAPFSLRQLNVRGDELIAAGTPPEKTAETLHFLLGECAANPSLNVKEKLLRLASGKNCQ